MIVSASPAPQFRIRQPEMLSTDIRSGTMMIREGLLVPDSAHLESRGYSNTWRTLVGVDSFAFDRKLRAVGLHLFFIAGELKAIELGWGAAALRRCVNRVLERGRKDNCNCMEIAQVTRSHFLGFPYVVIRAYSFHIQKDAMLQSNTERQSGTA
jgi:hypothetical protein